MNQPIELVAGDVGDLRRITLDGVQSLAGPPNVVAHIWPRVGTPANAVDLAATVTDVDEREVTVNFGGHDGWLATAVPGDYSMRIQVTSGVIGSGGTRLTWPTMRDKPISVTVAADTQ